MHHFALAHIILKSPASPAPPVFSGFSQHFLRGAGGDWCGIVGLPCLREVRGSSFALIYHVVKHLLFIGGDWSAVVVAIGNAWSKWIAS